MYSQSNNFNNPLPHPSNKFESLNFVIGIFGLIIGLLALVVAILGYNYYDFKSDKESQSEFQKAKEEVRGDLKSLLNELRQLNKSLHLSPRSLDESKRDLKLANKIKKELKSAKDLSETEKSKILSEVEATKSSILENAIEYVKNDEGDFKTKFENQIKLKELIGQAFLNDHQIVDYDEDGTLKKEWIAIGNPQPNVPNISFLEKEYYSNGQIMQESEYLSGKLISIKGYYTMSGVPLQIGTFANGNGCVNNYDAHGKLVSTSSYSQGFLTSCVQNNTQTISNAQEGMFTDNTQSYESNTNLSNDLNSVNGAKEETLSNANIKKEKLNPQCVKLNPKEHPIVNTGYASNSKVSRSSSIVEKQSFPVQNPQSINSHSTDVLASSDRTDNLGKSQSLLETKSSKISGISESKSSDSQVSNSKANKTSEVRARTYQAMTEPKQGPQDYQNRNTEKIARENYTSSSIENEKSKYNNQRVINTSNINNEDTYFRSKGQKISKISPSKIIVQSNQPQTQKSYKSRGDQPARMRTSSLGTSSKSQKPSFQSKSTSSGNSQPRIQTRSSKMTKMGRH